MDLHIIPGRDDKLQRPLLEVRLMFGSETLRCAAGLSHSGKMALGWKQLMIQETRSYLFSIATLFKVCLESVCACVCACVFFFFE